MKITTPVYKVLFVYQGRLVVVFIVCNATRKQIRVQPEPTVATHEHSIARCMGEVDSSASSTLLLVVEVSHFIVVFHGLDFDLELLQEFKNSRLGVDGINCQLIVRVVLEETFPRSSKTLD